MAVEIVNDSYYYYNSPRGFAQVPSLSATVQAQATAAGKSAAQAQLQKFSQGTGLPTSVAGARRYAGQEAQN
jgi:hypothetical protein